MRAFKLHPTAANELRKAIRYYGKLDRSLSIRFTESVYASIMHLCEYPQSGYEIFTGYRRWSVTNFPFTIIYQAREDVVFVLAITHSSRRPGTWLLRLE